MAIQQPNFFEGGLIMSNKLFYLISFLLVLGLAATSPAGLDDDPNLVGWWKFDGDALDSSGNGLDGTLMGDPAPVFAGGMLDQALDTTESGGPGYVAITGYKGIEGTSAFSISAWINSSDNDGVVMAWGTGGGGVRRFEFRVIGNNRLRAESSGNIQSDTTFARNEWVHVAFTKIENGVINDPDSKLYLNGVDDTRASTGSNNMLDLVPDGDVTIARRHTSGRWLDALIDDVRLYDRELVLGEVRALAGLLGSYNPDPADGALVEDVSVLLGWTPGIHAVEHDVYFGTNPVPGPNDLLARQTETIALVGDLVQEQTYYWRVDDVTADANTIYKGDVWSFWVPPQRAYDPVPADGERILDTTVNLSWTGGWSPIMHAVYFGTDPNQVANDVGAPPVMDIGFDPGPLENSTTYYWRVDEFYGTHWATGPVWSFNTVPVLPTTGDPNLVAHWTFDGDSGGVLLDHSGNANHAVLRDGAETVVGRDGEVLDFGDNGYAAISNLVYDANNAALPEITVSTWIRTDSEDDQYILSFDRDENYRLEIAGNGGGPGQVGWDVMTLLDGAETMVDHGSVTRVDDGQWHHIAGIFDNGTLTIYIDGFAEPSATGGPVFGTGATGTAHTPRYGLIGDNSEAQDFDGQRSDWVPLQGEMDDLRIYDKAFSEDEMRQLHGNLAIAWQPLPDLGDVNDVWIMRSLSWTAGDGAVEHDVYLGTDPNAVAAADASDTTGIYRGRQADTLYTAPETLEFSADYYWRIDEVAADGTISIGHVWPFSTLGELVLFDVETPFPYDNSVDPFLSEISVDADPAQNWADPIGRLVISYTGQAAPGSVAVDDANGTITVVGRGNDIWDAADEFQYAYTTLTGDGSMVVKVDSLEVTDDWTKAGIMVRETLDPGSAFAGVFATGVNGVRFQARATSNTDATSDTSVATDEQKALVPPVWLKIERAFPMVNAYYSVDGVAWTPMSWNSQVVPLISPAAPIHIGLAVVSGSGADTYAEAVFSNLSSDGGVAAGPLASAEVGDLASNAAEPMYLALTDAAGTTAAVLNPDPAATQQASATDWIVNLDDYGIDRTAVASATLIVGNLDAPAPGGSGLLTIHNIRLLPPLLAISPISDLEAEVDPDDPYTLVSVLGINGTSASGLIVGTTTADVEKYANDPASDADNFDLTEYANLNGSTWIQTLFDQPVTTIFIMERGANDSGFFQAIDANGDPFGEMLAFTAADFQFQNEDMRIAGQTAGGIAIEASEPISGLLILPPNDRVHGIDPASISAIPE
jgi:hypothetical protein